MENAETCSYFNSLQWHDSKLRSFAIVHESDRDDVVFQLEMRGLSELELTPSNPYPFGGRLSKSGSGSGREGPVL